MVRTVDFQSTDASSILAGAIPFQRGVKEMAEIKLTVELSEIVTTYVGLCLTVANDFCSGREDLLADSLSDLKFLREKIDERSDICEELNQLFIDIAGHSRAITMSDKDYDQTEG